MSDDDDKSIDARVVRAVENGMTTIGEMWEFVYPPQPKHWKRPTEPFAVRMHRAKLALGRAVEKGVLTVRRESESELHGEVYQLTEARRVAVKARRLPCGLESLTVYSDDGRSWPSAMDASLALGLPGVAVSMAMSRKGRAGGLAWSRTPFSLTVEQREEAAARHERWIALRAEKASNDKRDKAANAVA